MAAITGTWRVVESEARTYRRVWRGTAITYFVNPIFFLSAMGLMLGSLIPADQVPTDIEYLVFIATGLLAATSMQNGAGDGAWAVMAGIKWRKNFHAAIVTPIDPADLVLGRTVWGAVRNAVVLVIFVAIAFMFGALQIGAGLLGVLPAVFTGIAFSSATTLFTVTRKDDTGQALTNLFRFGIMPMFLFSGTFFPIAQLPDWLQPVAWVTPLFHGVELVRKLSIEGAADLTLRGVPIVSGIPIWAHVAYLGAMTGVSLWLASRFMTRKLKQ